MKGHSSQQALLVLGGQWGDEGKGKVVDLLSAGFKAVVRYNGGHNAGHTVKFGDRHFALHLVPSGIIHAGSRCYMGAWMVVDPLALVAEIADLGEKGVDVNGRLTVSPRATLILPSHQALDLAREQARGASSIGTTGRGIGPAYQDLAQRRALRAGVLTEPDRLEADATALMESHNRELELLFGAAPVDIAQAMKSLRQAARVLSPLVGEIGPALNRHGERGEPILFEGAQGIMLDLYHGTYPYVTSSSCLPGAAAVSCGIPIATLGPALGVMKAYVTRVGGGPFPTEIEDEVGDRLRERGNEFGTTTGRPRRCGWFDAVAARYAVRVAGLAGVALMKLDVLDGLEEIRVAVGYKTANGRVLAEPPADARKLAEIEPVYTTLPGWGTTTRGITREKDLPPAARAYLEFFEDHLGVPIVLVSTGPRREETLIRGRSALAERLRHAVHTVQEAAATP
ncbi:MAG: adenylosuccinate synthase [Acidobacteria bacterium]|nr:adenylosuccinate synthase [Acidobacteriota bacterium]